MKGALEHKGACAEWLEVIPTGDAEEVINDVLEVAEDAQAVKEVGKAFLVSTISVRITT